MCQVVLGSFGKLELFEFTPEGKLEEIKEISTKSCLFSQSFYEGTLFYAFESSDREITICQREMDGTEVFCVLKLQESPYNIRLSPNGKHVVVLERTSYHVFNIFSEEQLLKGIATAGGKLLGGFERAGGRFVYEDGDRIILINLETKEAKVVYTLKNFRLVTLGFAGRYVIVAAPYFDNNDVGFVRVLDGDAQVLNQNYQKADSFELKVSEFGGWFVAIAKCEVDDTETSYEYYGTRQLHFYDIKGRKTLNFSTSAEQVHSVSIQVLNKDMQEELLTYITEKIPTLPKLAIVETHNNVCTLKEFALGFKTTLNSISAGPDCIVIRGEGNMDGMCYVCKVNPEGESFASILKPCGKAKILYKTHVEFARGLILMGTLSPRLNVDNGVWVYDQRLNEVSCLEYEKLMRMEVLLTEAEVQCKTLTNSVEGEVLTYESSEAAPKASAYVPPGMRAKEEARSSPSKSQSFSLFE